MPQDLINKVRLDWDMVGTFGDPLVLVHDSWADRRIWKLITPSLAQFFRVLVYDRRGHGRSEAGGGRTRIDQDAEDLAGLMEHLGLAPAHIAGDGYGGMVALRFAGQRPDLIRSLIVHQPPALNLLADVEDVQPVLRVYRQMLSGVAERLRLGDVEGAGRRWVEAAGPASGTWDQLSEEQRSMFSSSAQAWLEELTDETSHEIELERIEKITQPVLLTYGTDSQPFHAVIIKRLADELAHVMTEHLPGAGFAPQVAEPESYLRVIITFIRRAAMGAL